MTCLAFRPVLAPALVGAAWAAALAFAPVAHAHALYDKTRVLAHAGNECVGQKARECITIASTRLPVAKGGVRRITLACTAKFPHLVGWDSAQHEHLRLVLVEGDPAAKAAAKAEGPDHVSVLALNNGNARGYAKVFAGCSSKPWAGTPFMSAREGLPTNSPAFGGGKP